jgi:hypothetical protein
MDIDAPVATLQQGHDVAILRRRIVRQYRIANAPEQVSQKLPSPAGDVPSDGA